ncbi:hypothetical protein MMC32_005702 [Xylographa parallela]|nr:hypothetical protein [Xylographa parallela]
MNSDNLPRKLPFSKKTLPKRIILSYLIDYVIILVGFIAFWALDAVEPFNQHFSLLNYTLQYPYALHERVPVALLFFVAVVCPGLIIALYTLVIDGRFSHHRPEEAAQGRHNSLGGRFRMKDRLWELNCGILGLILASGTAFVITGALKNATGKPRPDLIARCLPRLGSADLPVFGLSNSTICTQTDNAILKDGFRSFPSGHSSTAFGGLFYLSLYLAAKLHVLDNRGEVWKAFVVLIPTLGAALIAVSRIMDARHHPFDVISGSLLGILTAFCSYRQYFPPVSEAWRKGRAYPIRSWATEPLGPTPMHAEREMARDQGVEPLRTAQSRVDEEQTGMDFPTGVVLPDPDVDPRSSGHNVFRKQIIQSEISRQQDHPSQQIGQPSNLATLSTHKPSNSFPRISSPRGRPIHDGEQWSSSEDGGEDIELEMQPNYALGSSHPYTPYLGYSADPQSGFDAYTAYDPENYAAHIEGGVYQQPPGQAVAIPQSGDLGIPQDHLTHQ